MFVTSPIMLGLACQGLTFALPKDIGEQADSIVILGRGEPLRSKRVELGSELWQQKRAPRVFVSGMLDAEEIITQLEGKGIPKHQIIGERCSQNTEENAEFTSAILHPQGIKKILLLTDLPHMLRAKILFQDFGFTVIPYPIALPLQWDTAKQLEVVFREYAGLFHYQWQGYLRQRTQDEIDRPSEMVVDRLKNWNCQINSKV